MHVWFQTMQLREVELQYDVLGRLVASLTSHKLNRQLQHDDRH